MRFFFFCLPIIFTFVFAESALSQVYYMNTDGGVSDPVNIDLEDSGRVDVIAILDEGTDVERIISINRSYVDHFNFVNPIAASGKYSVLFSINSKDEIIERYKNSGISVNKKSVSSGILQDNESCFIRIVYNKERSLVAYNMYVLDGDYSSYDNCLKIYYDEFLNMTR